MKGPSPRALHLMLLFEHFIRSNIDNSLRVVNAVMECLTLGFGREPVSGFSQVVIKKPLDRSAIALIMLEC